MKASRKKNEAVLIVAQNPTIKTDYGESLLNDISTFLGYLMPKTSF